MIRKLLAIILLLALTACSVEASPEPLPTATPVLPTETPTATRVWFPPTPTYTPFPTPMVTPTQAVGVQKGELLLEDDFSSPADWEQPSTDYGAVGIDDHELSIVLSQSKASLATFRKLPVFTDFYAEVTASPTFCNGSDEYGMIFRAGSAANFYRFSLGCSGQVRMDRLLGAVASSPQPWIDSGSYPPGAPSIARIGVWASGPEMRFYINDVYQFSVRDGSLPSGYLGLFARTSSSDQVTVSFSKLQVWSIGK